MIATPSASDEQRLGEPVGPPAAERVGDDERGERDGDHVGRADGGRAEPAAEQQRVPRQRPDEQRLEQPALRVAADRAEREEDGEDGAEEQDREHREPGERRADDDLGVDARPVGPLKSSAALNACQRGEAVEREEDDGQQADDDETRRRSDSRSEKRATISAPRSSPGGVHGRLRRAARHRRRAAGRRAVARVARACGRRPRGRRPRASTCAPAPRTRPRPRRRGRARSAARPRASASGNARTPPPSRPRRRPARLSSAGVPAATTSPPLMIATRSQTSSTSDSRCEFSSTLTPRSRRRSSSARTCGGRRGRARSSARRAAAAAARRSAPGRGRAAAACPSTSRRRGGRGRGRARRARAVRGAPPRRRASRQLLVQREQLVGRAPVGEAEQLGEVPERACAAASRPGCRRCRRAGGRPHEPAGDLHQRRLARAVRAQQAEQLARPELEVDAAQRLHRAVGLAQAGDRQGGDIRA